MTIAAMLVLGGPMTMNLWPGAPPGDYRRDKPESIVDGNVHDVHTPTLTAFLPHPKVSTGVAVVVCPGGGYNVVCIEREGYRVARWLSEKGIAAFVLKYRLAGEDRKEAWWDAQRAVRIVRSRAKEWQIDPKRVGILGFSAGGHLAARTACESSPGSTRDADRIERQSARPDFLVAIYGYLDPVTPIVTHAAPPAFLAHSQDDKIVGVEQSRSYANACRKATVPVHLEEYATGDHGWDMGIAGTETAQWAPHMLKWLKERGILAKNSPP